LGFLIKAVDWDVERDNGGDSDRDGVDWDDVECVVEDINYSGVFEEWDEEWEVELACGLE
jgi:hypothetical protein